jgi:hypothetical protein
LDHDHDIQSPPADKSARADAASISATRGRRTISGVPKYRASPRFSALTKLETPWLNALGYTYFVPFELLGGKTYSELSLTYYSGPGVFVRLLSASLGILALEYSAAVVLAKKRLMRSRD